VSVVFGCLIGPWAAWLAVLCCAGALMEEEEDIKGKGVVFMLFVTLLKESDQPTLL
jgi:hypothetical protein